MKVWPCALSGLACLALAGCRSDPNTALLERELRLQEDKIYALQDRVEDCQAELLSARRENTALRQQLDTDQDESERPVDLRQPAGVGGPIATPLVPPVIDLPMQSLPKGEVPESLQRPAQPIAPRSEPAEAAEAAEAEPDASDGGDDAASPAVMSDSRQVTHLALRTRLCGGYDSDGRPGDEGITVVFEPHDERGRYVEAPADVSIVVVDPAILGEAGRVARWSFTTAETARAFADPGMARGIALEMAWPNDPPAHGKLHLFVRYMTADGRKVQADGPIHVVLEEQRTAGWVPTEPARSTFQARRPARPRQTPPPARTAKQPSPSPATPEIQRPLWSPDRP